MSEAETTEDQEPAPLAPPAWDSGDAAGWGTSLVVHAALALLLTLLTFSPVGLSDTFDLLANAVPSERIDNELSLDQMVVELTEADFSEDLSAEALTEAIAAPSPVAVAAAPLPTIDLSQALASSSLTAPTDPSMSIVAGVGADGRTAEGKAALVAAKGGSPASEKAVAQGLRWLAQHQNPDGAWSLIHDRGACRGRCKNVSTVEGDDPFAESVASATGLALLPFLGAGETPRSGRHRKVVRRGLEALVQLGKPDKDRPGLSWADNGRLYAHGICTIALCEAYTLTGESSLRRPAEQALRYLASAQDPRGGGWRYRWQQAGDTSVTGWQIMALKSGQLAGLELPKRVTSRAVSFLDSASNDDQSAYGYLSRAGTEPVAGKPKDFYPTRPTVTAVGLLCRQYLGWDQNDKRLKKGIEKLAKRGPIEGHFYHNYYAAQTIFHQTGGVGAVWRQWNEAAREYLIESQETRGHERGSWWAPAHHNERGGRLYSTALATMTLEVYYRYLPIYKTDAVATALPD